MFSQVDVCPQSASWLLVHWSSLFRRGRYASYWNSSLLIFFCRSAFLFRYGRDQSVHCKSHQENSSVFYLNFSFLYFSIRVEQSGRKSHSAAKWPDKPSSAQLTASDASACATTSTSRARATQNENQRTLHTTHASRMLSHRGDHTRRRWNVGKYNTQQTLYGYASSWKAQ